MSDAHPPTGRDRIAEYHRAVDRGARSVGIRGGVRVWRVIKHVGQLLVISFAFWGGVTGQMPATVAFGGMLLALLGTESLETFLAAAGGDGLDVTIATDDTDTDEQQDTETDGGRAPAPDRGRES